jgi:hypothetical protein
MAVVATVEIARGTGVSGKYGESFTFTRRWIVRVDSPSTSVVTISRAAGVKFNDPHPEFSNHRAMEFDLTEESGDGMAWGLTVKYYVPPVEMTPSSSTGLPQDFWSASGSTSTIPVYLDKNGDPIVNSAGDPLEGAEREATDFSIVLTKVTADLSWSPLAATYTQTVNSSTWNGSAPRTVKCMFRSANKKFLTPTDGSTDSFPYWESVWEFAYRAETWDYKPWDIGFNQRVTANGNPEESPTATRRAVILGADKRPVKSPVALRNGVAKTPGLPPDALTFRLYQERNFSIFGTPS